MSKKIRQYAAASVMAIGAIILIVTNLAFILSLFKYGFQHIEYSADMIGYIMHDVVGLVVFFIGRLCYKD